ncbi:hypothetical protein HJC23_009819 [Cyclotella cryptica]|uniref:Orc1-like AAA ATPase domain-containing protein n=1 Tax=Cyclotella cryptica TaxID=29204 RepID=A0ABD3PIA0_9STRA|eukprot:CCRYP_014232-RA/>CCRYP_014232-RA protein AED:0.02 eAED:0.02 QI:231/1/0.75/1/1/1/4/400/1361
MSSDSMQPNLNNDLLASALGNASMNVEWSASHDDSNQNMVSIPLRQWHGVDGGGSHYNDTLRSRKDKEASIVRKLTVAYAVTKVLQHIAESRCTIDRDEIKRLCSINNFVVKMSTDELSDLGWEVRRVDVASHGLTVHIASNWVSGCDLFDLSGDATGRNVEATIISSDSRFRDTRQNSAEAVCDERMLCCLLGQFLHSFLCGDDSQSATAKERLKDDQQHGGCAMDSSFPSHKKKCFLSAREKSTGTRDRALLTLEKENQSGCREKEGLDFSQSVSSHEFCRISSSGSECSTLGNGVKFMSLHEIGYPSALSQLVKNLLDCGSDLFTSDDSYRCLEEVMNDIHIILLRPGRFLFDQHLSGGPRLAVNKDKLYGRDEETAILKDTFCRVTLTGQSEAVCVSGFSGCGKTRLVQSMFESVDAAGGNFVVQKFDETQSQSPLSVVLSALNDLCGLIVEKHSREELRDLYNSIKDQTNLTLLSRVLPNVIRMNSSDTAVHILPFNHGVGSGLNFHMLAFAVMRLMRIISSQSRPVMIFLDDLQWADTASLDLIHAILSDVKGLSCVFFVGSYRDQDVKQGHFVFEFICELSAHEVPCTELHLDGLAEDDVNHMLSDALCVIPRLCKSLSGVVCHKTRGSPFFVIEFLNSLIDRGILSYSLRERRWCWDIDQICQEDITDNVLQMIHDKMSFLEADDKKALEVASCFGIEINESIVKVLSETPLYCDLQFNLDNAVQNGFMERAGQTYRFMHDKVREAAYSLVDSKDEYHFNIGMSLCSILLDQNSSHDWTHRIPRHSILAQINRGVPSLLTCERTRSCVAELNYEESVEALESSDFTSAYIHIKAAVSLLPNDTWSNNYDRSIAYFLQFAKAAYPSGYISEAKDSLHAIIKNERSPKETCSSYFLLTKILFLACKELSQASDTCRKLLLMLGEDVPDVERAKNDLPSQISEAKRMLENSDFLHDKETQRNDWKSLAIMQAYDQLVTITFMSHPYETSYYIGRWAQYTLRNRVTCRHTPKCIVALASILCRDLTLDARIGYKFCKQALVLMDHSYLEDVSEIFLTFYGFIGVLFEPLQACLDMHRRGYELAMQAGNLSVAAFHKIFVVGQSLKTGENLLDLKEEVEIELSLATHRSQSLLAMRLRYYSDTIVKLIGDESTGRSSLCRYEDLASYPNLMEAHCLNDMMSSMYLGNPQRIQHLSKLFELSLKHTRDSVAQRSIYVAFFCGLSVAATYRAMPDQHNLTKLDDAISIVAKAATFSEWNFKNKVALLKAELASVENDNDKAEVQYDVAIAAAHSSKFIHEEGLACELAGRHYKNHGNEARALDFFREAHRCYQEWGSKVKASQMELEIASVTASTQSTVN